MSRHSFPRLLLLVVPLLAACMKPPPVPISDADKAALRAAHDKFAEQALAKNWAAVAGMYAENATVMPPNQAAVSGRAAIQTWLTAFPTTTAFKLTVDEVEGLGDLAYVRGTYDLTLTVPGAPGPVNDHGKYVDVNRRNADGTWSMTNDIWNSDLPAQAPPPAPAAPAKHK